ncbi:hypothetical protein T4D_17041 [Trichinella pseudospiralis]|uniref:Uncharacterized protein n=1 Tax=Trichinella pseudospiralis TaxID=6337 RepID=A0A0V1FGQ2_TRIPS|nr:hypothetical protein T4D_17041 [Trichinella pseudospiralis]
MQAAVAKCYVEIFICIVSIGNLLVDATSGKALMIAIAQLQCAYRFFNHGLGWERVFEQFVHLLVLLTIFSMSLVKHTSATILQINPFSEFFYQLARLQLVLQILLQAIKLITIHSNPKNCEFEVEET